MNDVVNIGSRRELMVDDFLIERLSGGIRAQLHTPTPREVALVTDRPWEGNMCGWVRVLRDPASGRFRMYYKASDYSHLTDPQPDPENDVGLHSICMAESADGINWERPLLDLYPTRNGEKTNIVFRGLGPAAEGWHGFAPFVETNPAVSRHEIYRAVGSDDKRPPSGIYVLASHDGIHWRFLRDEPVFTKAHAQRMRFDSQNVLFWDAQIERYRLYFRDYDDNNIRCIRLATSADLAEWSEPEWLDYGPNAPVTQLYTSNIQPYARAPHLLLGFPARYVQREWSPSIEALPELEHRRFRATRAAGVRCGTALSDGLFMSSRDGLRFKRWDEAFFRPGLHETGNWAYGDNYPSLGMLETVSLEPGVGRELSFYVTENYWRGTRFRRHVLRMDGFVSLTAEYAGGEMVTKPFTFAGGRLSLNIATSAAGSARVEIQDASGAAIPGFALADCHEIIGDTLDYRVAWTSGRSVECLAGQPVRLRFALRDTALYALQFTD